MQACVTKWFKPMDPSKVSQYHDWLFEKEAADRVKREAERQMRIKASNKRRSKERARLRAIQREKEKKRKEAERLRREEEARRREELAKRKFEGQEVVPGVFVGGRLAAQNIDWLSEAFANHNLTSVLNCTPNLRHYFDANETMEVDDDDDGSVELQELQEQLNHLNDDKMAEDAKLEPKEVKESAMQIDEAATIPLEEATQTKTPARESSETNKEEGEAEAEEGEAPKEEEDELFKTLETLDDDAKLALLESIKLPGDEEDKELGQEQDKEEEQEEQKEDKVNELLEQHKRRLKQKRQSKQTLTLKYGRVPIDDDGSVDISSHFEAASRFIRETLKRGEAVLVHCREGRSRSVAMILAFLIIEQKHTLEDAMALVHKAISDENVNQGFKRQLMALESSIHGSNSVDYTAKRSRNATINPEFSDNISEVTGAKTRPKRRRAAAAAIAKNRADKEQDNDDEDYMDLDDEGQLPPKKVRASRRKSGGFSKAKSDASSPEKASTLASEQATSSSLVAPAEKSSTPENVDAVAENFAKAAISTPADSSTPLPEEPVTQLPFILADDNLGDEKPPNESDVPQKTSEQGSPAAPASSKPVTLLKQGTSSSMDVDEDILVVDKVKRGKKKATDAENTTNPPSATSVKPASSTSKKPSPSASTASPKKGNAGSKAFPAQSNTLLKYFTKQ